MAGLQPFLYETLTVGAAATQLPVRNLSGVEEVEIAIENGTLRMRLDATDPTATAGPLYEKGYTRRLNKYEAAQARFIRDGDQTVDVTVQTTYYRRA